MRAHCHSAAGTTTWLAGKSSQVLAVQGGVVFLLLAVGTLTQLLLARFASRPVMTAGLGLFLAALALIAAALSQASMTLFLAGTITGGIAVGAIFLGSLATANRLAPPGRRGQVISTYFVLCYCGLIIPVIGVGGPRAAARRHPHRHRARPGERF